MSPQTPPNGLTQAQAASLLASHGPNVLPQITEVPAWRHLIAQFVHFFALMLWVAAVLAWLADLPQLSLAIVLVVLVNGLFAFVQEYRAERAASRLKALLPGRSTVIRGGRRQVVSSADLVPGDLVLLAEGDRVPADLRCEQAASLRVDTSTLTGESVPDSVRPGDELLAGTYVVQGTGTSIVERTGAQTRFARLAQLTQAQRRPKTPLERDLQRLVRTIAVIAAAVGLVFFALMLLLGQPLSQGLVFGIGVTVALVPEGLLPTVTLSLAIGAQRMADQQALVRRLESVETLGSTTVICSDKTGTITQNRMNVVAVWTALGEAEVAGAGYDPAAEVRCPAVARPAVEAVAEAARLASDAQLQQQDGRWSGHGDPMDLAVLALANRLGLASGIEQRVDLRPFDPNVRAVIARTGDRVVCKGAPEAVLAACPDADSRAVQALSAYAARGLRVLAVAQRAEGADLSLHDMTLLGLLVLEDPPRPGVAEAIASCRKAGIAVVMMTGDHPETARAIAAEVGLLLPGSPVLLGEQLPATDLARMVGDGAVLARITPEDKLRVAVALREAGQVVAMTGDGVNDAPALREADIGVAMGRGGTDVAREAADLVLLDDHFGTVVAAVMQGRATFLNARRFLTYHLTDNVAELAPFVAWAASGGSFPLALGVLQILALDLGTDTLPAIALGAERPDRRLLDHPPVSGGLLDRIVAIRAFGVLGPTEAIMELAMFVTVMFLAGWRPGAAWPQGEVLLMASGAAFLTVVVMQCANAVACRSTRRPVWRLPAAGNRFLLVAVVFALAFGAACLSIPPVASVLGQAWPPTQVLPLVALGVPLLWSVDAVWKRVVHGRART